MRLRHDTRATVEMAEIERELAALVRGEPAAHDDAAHDDALMRAGLSAAASLIVAGVLAETVEA